MGRVDGWGEEQDDGTWTAYCRISTGFHSVTTHQAGFKTESEAEAWCRQRAMEANTIIKSHGARVRKIHDCRISAVPSS